MEMDSQEAEIGRKNSGSGKKKIVIAILAIAVVAALTFALGRESSFSKLGLKSPSGFFTLANNQQGNNESALLSDSNKNTAEFKNAQLKASLNSNELLINAENAVIEADANSGIQAGNQTIKSADSKAKISGFSGMINSSPQGIVISGKAIEVSNNCMSSEFSSPQETTAKAERVKIENLQLKSLEALVQGSIEVSTQNGSAALNISKDSKLLIENFQGSIELQNGQLVLNGSAESLKIREE